MTTTTGCIGQNRYERRCCREVHQALHTALIRIEMARQCSIASRRCRLHRAATQTGQATARYSPCPGCPPRLQPPSPETGPVTTTVAATIVVASLDRLCLHMCRGPAVSLDGDGGRGGWSARPRGLRFGRHPSRPSGNDTGQLDVGFLVIRSEVFRRKTCTGSNTSYYERGCLVSVGVCIDS